MSRITVPETSVRSVWTLNQGDGTISRDDA
jgi:hypothetical protein